MDFDQRLLLLGSEPDEVASLRPPGGQVGEQRLLDRAFRWSPVPVEHWVAGVSSSMGGRGGRSSLSESCRISFLSSVNYCALNIFLSISEYRILPKGEDLETAINMNQYRDIDLGVLALLGPLHRLLLLYLSPWGPLVAIQLP